MAEKSRYNLKLYFETEKKPTQQQFEDLIDSFLHKQEDGISIEDDGKVGIGIINPLSKLHIKGGSDFTGGLLIEGAEGDRASMYYNNDEGVIIDSYRPGDGRHLPILLQPFGGDGKVGIGTLSPQAKLDVKGDLHISGKLGIGTSIEDDGKLGIGTINPLSKLHIKGGNDFTGGLLIEGAEGDRASMYYNSEEGVVIDSYRPGDGRHLPILLQPFGGDGKVGVGTLSPQAKLDVKGDLHISGKLGIGTNNPNKAKVDIESYSNINNPGDEFFWYPKVKDIGKAIEGSYSYSLYANEGIAAKFYMNHSDTRIKQLHGISNSKADLNTLLDLEVTDYIYRDRLNKGNTPQKKLIGQQIVGVFPQAVSKITDVVPDIYQRADLRGAWVQLATDLKVGERVKIITQNKVEVCEVLETTATAFRIRLDQDSSTVPLPEKKESIPVFVYGREVEDFHLVDYEAIAMLHVSATQELYRQVRQLQQELTALKKIIKPYKIES